MQHALNLRQLFSLSSLCDADLGASFGDLSAFDPQTYCRILERCSPAVKSFGLRVQYGAWLTTTDFPRHGTAAPIALASLYVGVSFTIDRWLFPALHPFTSSSLRALWLVVKCVQWPGLMAAMPNIEILRINTQSEHFGLDLAAFPKLSLLCVEANRVDPKRPKTLLQLTHSIKPTILALHHIRTLLITINEVPMETIPELCKVLDESLSAAHVSSMEVEVSVRFPRSDRARIAQYFPRSRAVDQSKKFNVEPYKFNWWEKAVRRL
ncbi:hypothetical protein C8R47DRAFT_722092 [Mycena vitilis]|nr:hypothetical protein C8R47DRAFT_722092 [Mycena vitilis]